MKKVLIGIVVLVVLFVSYKLLSPLWTEVVVDEAIPVIQSTEVAKENTPTAEEQQVKTIKQGTFTGFDRTHNGSGVVSIISVGGKNFIRFEEDFVVTNGPDLYVGLGEAGKYIKGSELAKLKGTKGSQNYELPASTSPESIKEVWVWCKAFSVPFAKAVLE